MTAYRRVRGGRFGLEPMPKQSDYSDCSATFATCEACSHKRSCGIYAAGYSVRIANNTRDNYILCCNKNTLRKEGTE